MAEDKQPPLESNLQQSGKNDSSILPQWLIKLCRPSRMLWLGPLLGFMLSVPFLFSGFKLDDHLFKQQVIDKSLYIHRAVWDYFNWVSSDTEAAGYRERGIYLDWLTPDAFRFRPFRPLASIVHAFQFRFFGDSPWIMHIVLALLYALLIFLCAKLLTRFSLSSAAVGIGILIFAVDDTHSYSSASIMSYNTMLCCGFGLFALLMHDRWRQRKSNSGLMLSIAGFLLSLLSSEGGLAFMGYLLAYALFLEPGTWKKRAASLIPGVLVTAGYLVFYSIQHFGAKCFTAYLSPADEPWMSTLTVLSNTVVFTLSKILSLSPLTAVLQLTGAGGVVVAAVLLAIIAFIFRDFLVSNRTAAFFGTGMVLSIVPFTLGFISDRLLLWAGLGAAGLLGELFTSQSAKTGKPQRIFAKTLLVFNTVFSLILFIPTPFLALFSWDNGALALEKKVPSQNTVLLNSSNGFSFLYAPAIRCEKGKAWPEHFYYLYCGMDTLTVKRTGERTLLATPSKGWFPSEYERSRRPKQLYFKQGDTINLQLMTAVIEKASGDGRPLGVSFTFKRDFSEFAWMRWTKNGPEKCEAPAMGEEMRLFAPLF